MIGHHEEPSVYYIQVLDKDKPGQPKVVNQCQLFGLNPSSPPSNSTSSNDGFATIPSFLTSKSNSNCLPKGRHSDGAHEFQGCSSQICSRGGVGHAGVGHGGVRWVMQGWGGVMQGWGGVM